MKKSDITIAIEEVKQITSERSKDYTDGYLRQIAIMDILFPSGAPGGKNHPLRVKIRHFFLFNLVAKIVRFADNIYQEEGHPDSRLDMAGYSVCLMAADKEEADKS